MLQPSGVPKLSRRRRLRCNMIGKSSSNMNAPAITVSLMVHCSNARRNAGDEKGRLVTEKGPISLTVISLPGCTVVRGGRSPAPNPWLPPVRCLQALPNAQAHKTPENKGAVLPQKDPALRHRTIDEVTCAVCSQSLSHSIPIVDHFQPQPCRSTVALTDSPFDIGGAHLDPVRKQRTYRVEFGAAESPAIFSTCGAR
jgi:hypothetical protein